MYIFKFSVQISIDSIIVDYKIPVNQDYLFCFAAFLGPQGNNHGYRS